MSKNTLVLALVIVAVGAFALSREQGSMVLDDTSDASSQTGAISKAKKTPTPTSENRNYGELVREYRDYRIQFDATCQPIPKDPSFKSGSTILLDNRAPEVRTVKVGNNSYTLPGYGYKLINLGTVKTATQLNVTCGNQTNVGKILLQAKILQ